MNQRNSWVWLMVFVSAFFMTFIVFAGNKTGNEIKCQSVLLHSEHREESIFSYKVTQYAALAKNWTGYVHLTGEVIADGESFLLNRVVHFTYSRKSFFDEAYEISFTTLQKSSVDDLPENHSRRHLGLIEPVDDNLLKLHYLPSGDIVLTTRQGVFFICALR